MSDERDQDDLWGGPTNTESGGAPKGRPPEAPPEDLAPREHPKPVRRAPAPQGAGLRFHARGGTKVAVLGARESGKSYLFQAMTYRASNPARSGALKYFLKNAQAELFEAAGADDELQPRAIKEVNAIYKRWERLAATKLATQRWYKLLLRYKTGWLGVRQSELYVDLLDGSGDSLQQKVALMRPEEVAMWERAYLPARVVIFCLPMWAAFPEPALRATSEEDRQQALHGFYQVVHNLKTLRKERGINHSVQTILALTMADDRRCALPEVRNHWIEPFITHAAERAAELGTGRGLSRYLAEARHVSKYLLKEFQLSKEHDVQKIPFELELNGAMPMLVPLSAIEGAALEVKSSAANAAATPAAARVFAGAPSPRTSMPSLVIEPSDPVPVHVELPLLLALCEQHNALI